MGVLLAVVALALLAGDHAAAQPVPVNPAARVYLVPLGRFPDPWLADLESHVKSRFGLALQRLPAVALEEVALDRPRQQVIAEELLALMQRKVPVAGDPHAILIGLTPYDLYIRSQPSWAWAFGMRRPPRLAVISSARMDAANWDQSPNDPLLAARLRKMTIRYLGFLYYGLAPRRDPTSVLFESLLGFDELDLMGEAF